MIRSSILVRKIVLTALLLGFMLPTSGCTLFLGFGELALDLGAFWGTTPIIPVPAAWSGYVEDQYHEEEHYNKVPILDPVEGENAPIFCLDPPSADEVIRKLPDDTAFGTYFLAETSRNNVRMVVELIVDRVDDPRYYPMAGPAKLHHCHYKCTVYYDKTIRSYWPVPFTHTDQTEEVVYIDHDHLIRCAGPASN